MYLVSRVGKEYESHVINALETIFVSRIFSSIHVRLTQIAFSCDDFNFTFGSLFVAVFLFSL